MPISLEDLTPEQLEELQGARAVLDALGKDPTTRREFQRLVKTIDPSRSFPELEAEEAVKAALADEAKKREDLEAKLREREIKDRIAEQREKVVNDKLVAANELPALEKFMVDNSLPDYEKAAKLYRAAQRTETPAPVYETTVLTLPDEKSLWENPILWARKQAAEAINEFNKARA